MSAEKLNFFRPTWVYKPPNNAFLLNMINTCSLMDLLALSPLLNTVQICRDLWSLIHAYYRDLTFDINAEKKVFPEASLSMSVTSDVLYILSRKQTLHQYSAAKDLSCVSMGNFSFQDVKSLITSNGRLICEKEGYLAIYDWCGNLMKVISYLMPGFMAVNNNSDTLFLLSSRPRNGVEVESFHLENFSRVSQWKGTYSRSIIAAFHNIVFVGEYYAQRIKAYTKEGTRLHSIRISMNPSFLACISDTQIVVAGLSKKDREWYLLVIDMVNKIVKTLGPISFPVTGLCVYKNGLYISSPCAIYHYPAI